MAQMIRVSTYKRVPVALSVEPPLPLSCGEVYYDMPAGGILPRFACCLCLAIFCLGLSSILLGGCSCYINADRNEMAIAVIGSAARKDGFDCYANLDFQAQGVNISATTLITCAEGYEGSLVGVSLKICYSHTDPTKNVLVTAPLGLVPRAYRFQRCAAVTYAEAVLCKDYFFGVLYAFIATVLLLVLLILFLALCNKCRSCMERRRVVIPDPSMEMTPEHL